MDCYPEDFHLYSPLTRQVSELQHVMENNGDEQLLELITMDGLSVS